MGCCGKGASIKGSKTQAFASGSLQAEVDMEESSLVRYVGRKSVGSSFNVYGFATNTQYRVKVGQDFYVANTDLLSSKKGEGILQKYEGTDFAFVLVEEEPVAQVETVQVGTLQVEEEEVTVVQTSETADTTFDFSVADTNLTVLKKAIRENGYSITELNGLVAYELSHKNRRSAITAIENAIEELKGDE